MKAFKWYLNILIPLILSGIFGACDPITNGGDQVDCNAAFDQQAMFQNIADHLIIPAYTDLQKKVTKLVEEADAFTAKPSVTQLEALRNAFETAYISWQVASPYEFGPAEEVFLRNSVNNFPLDITATQTLIDAEKYEFDQPDAFNKGFPALDYLLYGIAEDNEAIITKFADNGIGKRHRQFLLALVTDMQQRVAHTFNGWQNGYRETFINNTGKGAGTSLSLIINQLNQNYELIKREKIGVPSGAMTLGFTYPDRVEAPYSGLSKILAITALETSQKLYLGMDHNGKVNGLGLDDYLEAVEAQKEGEALNQLIQNQFETVLNTLNTLPNSLAETARNETEQLIEVYKETARQVLFLKTDMPAVLCVSITYIDNPSDSD